MTHHLDHLGPLVTQDVEALRRAARSYGDSWMRRGGVGAFMVMIRKADRLENQAKEHGWDIFKAIAADPSATGILDDIRDLRRYLLLIEAEAVAQGWAAVPKKPILVTDFWKGTGPSQPIPEEDDAPVNQAEDVWVWRCSRRELSTITRIYGIVWREGHGDEFLFDQTNLNIPVVPGQEFRYRVPHVLVAGAREQYRVYAAGEGWSYRMEMKG